MFVQLRTFVVKEGFADKIVERFSGESPVQKRPGFVDMNILVKRKRREPEEEVIVMERWESEEAWKSWETSPEHVEGHRKRRGQPQPDFIISVSHAAYEGVLTKLPLNPES